MKIISTAPVKIAVQEESMHDSIKCEYIFLFCMMYHFSSTYSPYVHKLPKSFSAKLHHLPDYAICELPALASLFYECILAKLWNSLVYYRVGLLT